MYKNFEAYFSSHLHLYSSTKELILPIKQTQTKNYDKGRL